MHGCEGWGPGRAPTTECGRAPCTPAGGAEAWPWSFAAGYAGHGSSRHRQHEPSKRASSSGGGGGSGRRKSQAGTGQWQRRWEEWPEASATGGWPSVACTPPQHACRQPQHTGSAPPRRHQRCQRAGRLLAARCLLGWCCATRSGARPPPTAHGCTPTLPALPRPAPPGRPGRVRTAQPVLREPEAARRAPEQAVGQEGSGSSRPRSPQAAAQAAAARSRPLRRVRVGGFYLGGGRGGGR